MALDTLRCNHLAPVGFKGLRMMIMMMTLMVVCRSSVIRMSSDRKQDVVTKTVEDERIQVGVLKSPDDNEDEDEEEDNEESEKLDDANKSGATVCCLNFAVKHFTSIMWSLALLSTIVSKK